MAGMARMVEWHKEWQNGRMAENGYITIHTYYLWYMPMTMTEWQNGGMAEWQNGIMVEWQNGRLAEWQKMDT